MYVRNDDGRHGFTYVSCSNDAGADDSQRQIFILADGKSKLLKLDEIDAIIPMGSSVWIKTSRAKQLSEHHRRNDDFSRDQSTASEFESHTSAFYCNTRSPLGALAVAQKLRSACHKGLSVWFPFRCSGTSKRYLLSFLLIFHHPSFACLQQGAILILVIVGACLEKKYSFLTKIAYVLMLSRLLASYVMCLVGVCPWLMVGGSLLMVFAFYAVGGLINQWIYDWK